MRAVIDIESLRHTRTGLGQYVYRLIDGFGSIVKNDEILLLNNSFKKGKETKPTLPAFDNPKIGYKNLKISKKILNPLWDSVRLPRIEHLIGDFDVYHAPTHNELPLTKRKKVLTIHDLSFMMGNWHLPEFKQYLGEYFPRAASKADLIIADSESTRKDVIERLRVDESRVKTVYLAASSFSRRIEDKNEISTILKKYSIDRDYILYVGTIEPRKNVANIIKAYDIFRSSESDGPLLVLCGGKGWMYEEIMDTFQKSPHKNDILFTGYASNDELPFLLSGALLFIYPSFYEGFGLPVLEAMACGAPVITSNISSLPEVAGDAAIQIKPDNVEEMANAIGRVAASKELRDEMTQKGFIHNSGFSWERCARETLEIYRFAGENL